MKKQILNSLNSLLIMTLLSSCTSGFKFQTPESIESKMARYKNKSDYLGGTPKFHVMNMNTDSFKSNRTRTPASRNIEQETTQMQNELNTSSYKKTYFMLLLSQYETLTRLTGTSQPQINVCPGFHSSIVELRNQIPHTSLTNSNVNLNFSLDTAAWNDEYLALFPELMLPLSLGENQPTLADIIKQHNVIDFKQAEGLVKQAIDTHALKLYKELEYLCENGASSNYYKFENLLTDIDQKKNFIPSKLHASILFKTTIFSNMILINSLQYQKDQRSIASYDSSSANASIVDQLDLGWIKTYLKEMNKRK
ncbi:MAG: hypothetical protein A2381_20030 [Bdellovibrionales bacterium RIFOXYB1_FULL_37_110]|nr:MAG: hypothetical protein A2181_03665 [Bdellovibrionales bacterium RIFOXYA1_FULL_38_20]OFZ51027.1 MAG: hypothetical protein A2417_19815 [Bdellovibrionales bacterium RIFOXYC1_FULL_37_79]OFZ53938.1 MAG: hypothetical protein A2328_04455 [Bdellovibrionales bacterium RIFOXYB2_FULL_36_6]OFZ60239.1 MAG: hypothetical protein A2381_20030 [Bdellovibrionales bacterium RIFOXYB1_FULL_37_110]OFZ63234.1 MAG: hypothetical protein A2577_01345 [Bdellovibrionales bacterium RIFOXYD1_FULL_36_51]